MDGSVHTRRDFLRVGLLAIPALAIGRRLGADESEVASKPLPVSDLDFLREHVPVMERSLWTNVVPRPARVRTVDGFDRMTIHHAGAEPVTETDECSVAARLGGVLQSHLDRNFGDIGYHFVIDYAGRVWEGRSRAYEGAHVSYQNERNLGVMLLGNFDEQDPSAAQVAALDKVVWTLRQYYEIGRTRVYGHRDLGHSQCPGDRLYPHVAIMRC